MRKAFTIFVILGLTAPLSAQMGIGRHGWPLGSPISFRGPVVRVDRDESGDAIRLLIQVNRSLQWVNLSSWTQVVTGLGFPSDRRSIEPGEFVEVSGYWAYRQRDEQMTIFADRIHRQNASALEMEGVVDAVETDSVTIRGLTFRLTEQSRIRASRAPEAATLGLEPGVEARVRVGWLAGEPVVLELEYGPKTVESEPLRFMGVLQQVSGSLVPGPAVLWIELGLDLPVYGRIAAPVHLTSQTLVAGELVRGAMVLIEGRFPPGESYVVAERIAADGNQNGNPFDDSISLDLEPKGVELRGEIQQLRRDSGTAGQLRVAGQTILYNSQTIILDCQGSPVGPEALDVGLVIKVFGRMISATGPGLGQKRDSVLAEKIELACSHDHEDTAEAGTGGDETSEGASGTETGGTAPGAGEGAAGGDGDGATLPDGNETPGDDEGEEGSSVEIAGRILAISSGAPEFLASLVVETEDSARVTVLVAEETEIRDRNGKPADIDILEVNMSIEVKGQLVGSQRILARRIEVKD